MKKIIQYFLFGVFLFFLGLGLFNISKKSLTNYLLRNGGEQVNAIIINEKNYLGNQKVKPEFSYSYLFIVNGKSYINNAHDISLNIGDTIKVQFVKNWPSFNRPLRPKE